MYPVIYTHFKPVPCTGQSNNGESKVNMVGYVSTKKRIRELQLAGLNLLAYRHAEYDFEHPEEDDGVTMDRMRDLGNDFEDYQAIRDEHLARFKAKQKAWMESKQATKTKNENMSDESSEAQQPEPKGDLDGQA